MVRMYDGLELTPEEVAILRIAEVHSDWSLLAGSFKEEIFVLTIDDRPTFFPTDDSIPEFAELAPGEHKIIVRYYYETHKEQVYPQENAVTSFIAEPGGRYCVRCYSHIEGGPNLHFSPILPPDVDFDNDSLVAANAALRAQGAGSLSSWHVQVERDVWQGVGTGGPGTE